MSETAERSAVGRVVLGAAVAAAGAAVGLLFTTKPNRLSGAGSLLDDLKERVEGFSNGNSRQQRTGGRSNVDEFADRRRERRKRRERRRQKTET